MAAGDYDASRRSVMPIAARLSYGGCGDYGQVTPRWQAARSRR
jgi:hypothetical protein